MEVDQVERWPLLTSQLANSFFPGQVPPHMANIQTVFHESKTIKVEKGHLVKLHFTDFDLAWTKQPDLKSTSAPKVDW